MYRVRADGEAFPERVTDACFYADALAVGYEEVFVTCQDGTVRGASKDGGVRRTVLARDARLGTFGGLATDDRYVYVSSPADGTLLRVDAASGETSVIAQGKHPGAVAVDADAVYVAMADGLFRIAKGR